MSLLDDTGKYKLVFSSIGSYDKTKEAGGHTLERFTEYICFVNHI